ncbi:hypothetical protein CQ047_04415 [Microbacterium sp. MYb72]|nr:hypothetical protein CQ047_04415 [Microbacterium sp. MYb72]
MTMREIVPPITSAQKAANRNTLMFEGDVSTPSVRSRAVHQTPMPMTRKTRKIHHTSMPPRSASRSVNAIGLA